jgi:hypothetical protein
MLLLFSFLLKLILIGLYLTRALSSLGIGHVRAICGSLSRGPLQGNVVVNC